jgi:hypothetical protein
VGSCRHLAQDKHHTMKAYGGTEVQLHALLTSDASGQLHAPASLPRGQVLQYTLDRKLGGPLSRSGSGGEEKKIPAPAGSRNPIV